MKSIKREKKTPNYHVYYNERDGSIVSISSKYKDNIDYPYITTTDTIVRDLLSGNLDITKFIVAELVDGTKLVKREDLIHIQKAENYLSKVPKVKDTVGSDINIIVYQNPYLLEINVGKEAMYKLTGHRFRKVAIEKKAEINRDNINLYIVKHNNPLYLVDTISIDLIDLVNNGYILYDISHLRNKIGLADISILTKRIFKTYGLKIKNTYTSSDYLRRKSLKRYYFSKTSDEETFLFNIYKKENKWIFKSNFDKSDDLKIYNDIKFYVFDKTPNHLIDSFVIPKDKIGQNNEIEINVDCDLTKYNLMTNEIGKQISIEIEEPNE